MPPLLPIKLTPQLAANVKTAAVQPSLINGRDRPQADETVAPKRSQFPVEAAIREMDAE